MEIVQTPKSDMVSPAIDTARPSHSAWWDRALGSDPGLNRLRNAVHSVLTIGLIIAAETLFVHFTHALQRPVTGLNATQAVAAAGANHEYLVLADLMGALIGLISTLMIADTKPRGQLVSMALLPCAMVPAVAFGIVMGEYRVAALTLLAVILAVGTYLRRFGPRGFTFGNLLFTGYFIGFFLHAGVRLDNMGWLSAEIGVGVLVATAVRLTVFYPRPIEALHRTQRSYNARARKIAASALALFEDSKDATREIRRLQHQLTRLNEAALMIDAQLGDSSAVPDSSSAEQLHQRLFDVELALSNTARFAQRLARLDLAFDQRTEVLLTLRAVVNGDAAKARIHANDLVALFSEVTMRNPANETTTVLARRFASSVIALVDAQTAWIDLGGSADIETFQPSVALLNGWLPGSAQVSAAASRESGVNRIDRVRLAPYTRVAIQMGVAVGGAIILGVQLSSQRFYWAVIAAFVTFMGANSTGEQLRKGFLRVAGTVAGILIGSLLVSVIGHNNYGAIAVILGALFFGIYLLRVNYAFMVVGVTIMVSQLYQQLGEFSNSLLLLRLEETSVGAAFAMIVALTVLPLRTRRVLDVGMRQLVEAIGQLVEHASDHLLGEDHDGGVTMRGDARAIDAAYQALIATAQPLRRSLVGKIDDDIASTLVLASAARNYGRNLVADTEAAVAIDVDERNAFVRASSTLQASIAVVGASVTGLRDGLYVRSSSLFERAEQDLDGNCADINLALRDFKLIDGVMARFAEKLSLRMGDFDTSTTN